jgi:hypothetical protein
MGIRRPIGSESFSTQPSCDICKRPAAWRSRVITACCLYGEFLCDRCESKRLARQVAGDKFWADVADLVVLPFRKLSGELVADQSAKDREFNNFPI